MKLSKKSKVIIEWITAIILLAICTFIYLPKNLCFTPLQAFKTSERTINYGPSKIIKEVDRGEIKIYLSKYKNWISAEAFEKSFMTWKYAGGGIAGVPINYNDKITYSSYGSSENGDKFLWEVFGYVNDSTITKVTLQIEKNKKKESYEYQIDKSSMFIFSWIDNKEIKSTFTKIIGTDKNNKVVYEYQFPSN